MVSSPPNMITPLVNGTQDVMSSGTVSRRPLGTLEETPIAQLEGDEDLDDDIQPRRGRLRKRVSSFDPMAGGYSSEPDRSPSPMKRSAYDVLGKLKAPQFAKAKSRAKGKQKLGDNEFIEGEAVESDEEVSYGFGMFKKQDDEQELEGEDLDATLPGLMNDEEMDADTLNKEKVFEKVQ